MAHSGSTEAAKTAPLKPITENIDPAQVAKNIRNRIEAGKKPQEFSAQDWMEVFGLGNGEVSWSEAEEKLQAAFAHDENAETIAKNLTMAMKDVRRLYARFRSGEISEVDFLYESEWACLDAVVGILAAYLRTAPIKLKALGIVITDETLELRYQAIKDDLLGEWADMLARHAEEQRIQDEMLEERYRDYIDWLEKDLRTYREILSRAFSDDPDTALAGSAELARFMKQPRVNVLSTIEDVDDFFLG